MDSAQFDTLTTRLAAQLTRRRSLGLLGLLGVAGAGLAAEAEAKKKWKHKGKHKHNHKKSGGPKTPVCSGCTACEACVNGACLPLADGAPCGSGGVCTNEVCGQPCSFGNDQCPEPAFCPIESTVCVTGYSCDAPCETDGDCATGEVCMSTPNCAMRCGQIADI